MDKNINGLEVIKKEYFVDNPDFHIDMGDSKDKAQALAHENVLTKYPVHVHVYDI